jgi:hypothetical protein
VVRGADFGNHCNGLFKDKISFIGLTPGLSLVPDPRYPVNRIQ